MGLEEIEINKVSNGGIYETTLRRTIVTIEPSVMPGSMFIEALSKAKAADLITEERIYYTGMDGKSALFHYQQRNRGGVVLDYEIRCLVGDAGAFLLFIPDLKQRVSVVGMIKDQERVVFVKALKEAE